MKSACFLGSTHGMLGILLVEEIYFRDTQLSMQQHRSVRGSIYLLQINMVIPIILNKVTLSP